MLTDRRGFRLAALRTPVLPCLVTMPHIITKSSHFACTFTKAAFAAPVIIPQHRSDSLLTQFRWPDANTTRYTHVLPTFTHKIPLHESLLQHLQFVDHPAFGQNEPVFTFSEANLQPVAMSRFRP